LKFAQKDDWLNQLTNGKELTETANNVLVGVIFSLKVSQDKLRTLG